MSTVTRRTISIKIMQKVKLDELTTEDKLYPLTKLGNRFTLIINRTSEPEFIGIFFRSYDATKMYINCKLVNKEPTKSIEKRCASVIPPLVRGWRRYINLKDASDQDKGWLDDAGYLTLEVTISEPVHDCKVKSQSELVANLFKRAKTVKNLTLCSGDGKEYTMNEDIFASHSDLLATHLRNKNNGKVMFTSVPSHVMDEFIFYLESGLINESAESVAFDLAVLAHMYDLRGLSDMLQPLLVKQVRCGQLSRVMKIANLLDSTLLFEAIGEIEQVSEDLLMNESEDFIIEVQGETLYINQAYLAFKYPYLDTHKDDVSTALQGTSLQVAKGFMSFLKTSKLDDLSQCIFEYASLATALRLPELCDLVEQELVANMSKYDQIKVKDIAENMKSVKIFRALADLHQENNDQ